MRHYIDASLIDVAAVGLISLLAAGVMFVVGGSVAEVSDQEGNVLGVTFEAGGAIAGFIIVFLLTSRTLRQFRDASPKFSIKVPAVDTEPTGFSQARNYTCKYSLFATDTGTRQEVPAEYTWEAGFLTVFVKDVRRGDLVRVRIEDGGNAWESEDFQPYTRRTGVSLIPGP